jgi:hypothetical protein
MIDNALLGYFISAIVCFALATAIDKDFTIKTTAANAILSFVPIVNTVICFAIAYILIRNLFKPTKTK